MLGLRFVIPAVVVIALPESAVFAPSATAPSSEAYVITDDRPIPVRLIKQSENCTSCVAPTEPTSPPGPGGRQWVWVFGTEQCEDGYSASGPCSYCEGVGCEELELWDWDNETNWCEVELCDQTQQNLHADVLLAIEEGRLADIGRLISDNGSAFAQHPAESRLDLLDCGGVRVGTAVLPAGFGALILSGVEPE